MSASRRHILISTAAAACLGVIPAAWAQTSLSRDPLAGRFGGPFNLTDHNGRRVSEQTYRGRYMLVYFGFTRCTDACPVDVPNLVQALDLIAPLDTRIQPLFITVDPADTPEMMKAYVEAFRSDLVGLTGTDAELAAVAKAYRVHRYKVQVPRSENLAPLSPASSGPRQSLNPALFDDTYFRVHGDKPSPGQTYSINHGTLTYLMDPEGHFVTLVPHGSEPKRIAEVIRNHVKAA